MREISRCASILTNVGKQTQCSAIQWTCKLPNEIAAEVIVFISDIFTQLLDIIVDHRYIELVVHMCSKVLKMVVN